MSKRLQVGGREASWAYLRYVRRNGGKGGTSSLGTNQAKAEHWEDWEYSA